jgi:hypothetical protein
MPTVNFGVAENSPSAIEAYRVQMLPHVPNGMRLPSNSTIQRDGYAFAAGIGRGHGVAHVARSQRAVGANMTFASPTGDAAANALSSPFSSQFVSSVPAYLFPTSE